MDLNEKTVAFHTLGCKLNFAETSTIARDLNDAGMETVKLEKGADLVVINTCSVTEKADTECRSIVRKALRANLNSFIVVTGCYAQLRPSEIAALEGVDLVLGGADKLHLRKFINDLDKFEETIIHSCDVSEINNYDSAYSIGDRTRAFLKVQDGCDYKCSYCTIPMARGISRSAPVNQIILQARNLVKTGVKEIVLTGVNIGDYGKGEHGNKKHDHKFIDLLYELNKLSGLDRIRISSIEPNLLTDEIIEFVSNSEKFVPHFHIPLQSGNNEILGKMKRRYKRELYSERVRKIKKLMPDSAIGVDVIVGFPGETEEHFLDSLNFLNNLPISYLHVFTYSERPGTEAENFDNIIPKVERKARNHRLKLLSVKKSRSFAESHKGTLRKVLWEDSMRKGRMYGYTENYIRVSAKYDICKAGNVEYGYIGEIQFDDCLEFYESKDAMVV